MTPSVPERVIYVPYSDLENVFERPDGSVVLPYKQYQELWQRAHGAEGRTGEPPVDAVISRADYKVVIDGEIARIQADYQIRVIGKPWVELPLSFGDAAVGKVSSPQGDVLLPRDRRGNQCPAAQAAG